MSFVQVSTRLLLAVLSACSYVNGNKAYFDERHNLTIPIMTKSRLYEYATGTLPRRTYWISGWSPLVVAVFDPYNWIQVSNPSNAELVLLAKQRHYMQLAGEGFETTNDIPYLLNRVEGIIYLTDKALLHEALASLPNGEGLYAQPRTFVIESGKECTDFLAFPESNKTTWMKKDPRQAEGRGIEIYPPGSETRPCNNSEWEAKDPNKRIILQAHIDHPFLLNKKKSEMRAYWLIANVDPLIVLFYNGGMVRIATSDYEDVALDPTNALKHMCNVHQQSAFDPNYKETAEERLCSWLEMAEELKRLGRIQVEPQAWIDNSLLPAFQKIMRTCIDGARDAFKKGNRLGKQNRRFELIGMDVILEDELASNGTKRTGLEDGGVPLDGGLRMWMTEVQRGPGFGMQKATSKAYVPQLLQEQIEIALEIDWRKREGKSLSNLSSLRNFAVLINDATEDVGMVYGEQEL